MKRFDLYGSCSTFRSSGTPELLVLQRNAEDEEGYLTESDFPDWPTLVYIADSTRWVDLDEMLRSSSLTHLRTTEVEERVRRPSATVESGGQES